MKDWARYAIWSGCVLVGAACTFAPVSLKLDNRTTALSFAVGATALGSAWWMGRNLDRQVGMIQANNHIGYQWEIDRMVEDLNLGRAQFDALMDKILNGDRQQLPMMPGMMPLQLMGMPDPSALPAAQIPSYEQDEQYFDINLINPPNPAMGKNIIVVAEQGVGKTTLAKYLTGEILQSSDIQVYDLDDDGRTWGNLPVWGTGDDETQIAAAMERDLELFDQRTEDRVRGRKFGLSARIVDENPAVVDAIPDIHDKWSFTMGSRARKRGFVCILLTQERDPESNGLRSNRLRNYNQIYLGKKQINHALNYLVKPKAVADELRPKVAQCDRPALVEFNGDWFFWNVPNLREWEANFNRQTEQTINPSNDKQLGISDQAGDEAIAHDPFSLDDGASLFADNEPTKLSELERLFNMPSANVPHEKYYQYDLTVDAQPEPVNEPIDLPPEALAIISFSQRKGWVTVRDCQRGLNRLKGKSAHEIKELFLLVEQAGRGATDTAEDDTIRLFCENPYAGTDTTDS